MKSLLAAPRALRTLAQGAHFRRARRSDAGLPAGEEKEEEERKRKTPKTSSSRAARARKSDTLLRALPFWPYGSTTLAVS